MMIKVLLGIMVWSSISSGIQGVVDDAKATDLGEYKITSYSYAEGNGENYQTATGAKPKPWVTCAVDPDVIPYGTHLYIPDMDLHLIAEDCGGAVNGNHIDIHTGDKCEIGVEYHEVFIEQEGD